MARLQLHLLVNGRVGCQVSHCRRRVSLDCPYSTCQSQERIGTSILRLVRQVQRYRILKLMQSYICGSINTIGWITLTASVLIIPPQIIVGIIKFYDSTYTIERWHVFVLYQALNLLSLLYNLFALQRAPWFHDIGCE